MKYRLLTGVAAGAMIAFWTAAHSFFFPTLYWGVFPLVLGIIPFVAALLTGQRTWFFSLFPSSLRRYLPTTLALLLPAGVMGLYSITDNLAFVDGQSSIVPLLILTVIYGIGAGLPLAALAAAEAQREEEGDRLPWLLLGAGFGALGMTLLTTGMDLRLLFFIQAAASLPLVFNFPKDKAPDEKAVRKQEKELRLPSPWITVQYAVPLLITFVLPWYLYEMAQMPAISEGMLARMPAALLIAMGLGWQVGLMTARRAQGLIVGIVALIFAAGLLINLSASYVADWYPSMYTEYYQGAVADAAAQMLMLHLLGAVFFAAMGFAHIRKPDTPVLSQYMLETLLTAGIVGFLILNGLVFFTWIGVGAAGLLSLLALYLLLRRYRRETGWIIAASLWAAHLLLLTGLQTPGFHNFFNPQAFRIVEEEATPAGKMTLQQSRDYDDRFHALFWNQQETLTQASRAVQSDLYRMGHLPMFMGPEDASVLVLGLGSSIPIEAVQMHKPSSVTVVEPSAAILHLSDATRTTARPRPWLENVSLHNERIEAYLARTDEKVDVIISAEPLAEAGPAPQLFTTAWFQAISDHLSEKGIMAQWISLARMPLDGLRPVFSAAAEVFPAVELWISTPDPENAMVGIIASNSAFAADQPSRARFESLMHESKDMELHFRRAELGSYASLLSAYGANRAGMERLAGGLPPYGMFDMLPQRGGFDAQGTFVDIMQLFAQRTPPDRLLASADDSTRTLTQTLFQERNTVLRAKAAVMAGDDSSAVRELTQLLVTTPQNEEGARVLGDLFLRQAASYVGNEQWGPALALITRSLQLMPVNTYLLRLLMIASFNIGDREASGLAIDGIKRLDPSHAGFRDNQATIRAREGATDDALLLYENAITLDQTNEEFYCNMASFHYSQNRIWEAIRVLDQATQRAYYPAKALYLKGMFYAEQGQLKFSREAYEAYLKAASPIDPYRADVLKRLEELKKFEKR
ncbi:hypothetical protein KQI65_10215 [bacterium]|nr:hypothetical protein [bacterium]